MNTEIEVIKSKSLSLRVAKELGLDSDPEFQSRSRFSIWLERLGVGPPAIPEDAQQMTVDPDQLTAQRLDLAAVALSKQIRAERVPFSYVLSVSATSKDPLKAQRLAATVADDYLASQREARQEALQRVAAWLKTQVDDLQTRVLESDAGIEKLKARTGLNDVGSKGNVSEQQISDLNAQLMIARSDVAEKKARLDQARALTEGHGENQELPDVMASTIIDQLRMQQLELTRREAELSGKLGERHAEVMNVRAQLAGINRAISAQADRVVSNMKNGYEIAVRRERSIEFDLESLTAARGNSAEVVQLQQLRRVADADRKLYESYLSQFNEISTRQTLQDASARIITPATFPQAPSRILFFGFAGVLGTGIGLGLAVLLELLRSGVKSGAEAERTFGYPVVGLIPFVEPRGSRIAYRHGALVGNLVDVPSSQFSEAVRSMRLGLRLANRGQVPKVILITSAVPGEGKSSAAALLAASSAGAGQRTVLIDCDLRRQSISEAFGEYKRGLAEVLAATADVSEVTVKHPVAGIHLIPAGSPIGNPADLLTSERMSELIEKLRDLYDYVVLDASPLLPVVDALALAALADKILVVVEWSRTPRGNVSEALKILRPEAHRIAGIVLNKVDLKQLHGYGYNGGYSRRYFENYFNKN